MSKGASLKGVTHTRLCFPTMPGLLEETSPINQVGMQVTLREGSLAIEASRASAQCKVPVPGSSHRWRGRGHSQAGGCMAAQVL